MSFFRRFQFRYLAIAVSMCITTVLFQNCSRPHKSKKNAPVDGINAPATPDPVTLIGEVSFTINNKAPSTISQDIMLQMSASGAQEMLITETPFCEGDGQWETFTENKPWTLKADNQEVVLFAKFRKLGAPPSECVSASIVHDNTPPQISVTQKPPHFTNADSVTVGFSAQDAGSGLSNVYCKTHAGVESICSNSFVFSDLTHEGSYSLSLQAVDNAGNQSIITTEAFVVDRTAPLVTINGPSGAMAADQAAFELSVVESSGLESVLCKLSPLESSFKDCAHLKLQYSGLMSGDYKLEVMAKDLAGNDAAASQSFEVDLSVPTVFITENPLALGNETKVEFSFKGTSGAKPLTKFNCSLDSLTSKACTSPITFGDLSEGAHEFNVVGINSVNVESSPQIYKFTVDTTPPVLKIVSSPKVTNRNTNVTVVLEAQDLNGLKSVECQLNGQNFSDCSNQQMTYVGLADGTYEFQARATDLAGNISPVVAAKWSIDTSPDSQILAQLAQNPVKENATATLNIQLQQVTEAQYVCTSKVTKKDIVRGTISGETASVNFVITEDSACTVSGLDKVLAPIQVVVEADVACGNRIKENGKCVDFSCKKIMTLHYSEKLNIPPRSSSGHCYAMKLFDKIENSSSALTTEHDTDVISRNHDTNSGTINPYVLGKALLNLRMQGPRTVKLSGGPDATSAIRVDNFVLAGLYPEAVMPSQTAYSAFGTKDSTVDSAQSYIILKQAQIPLKSFGNSGTATVSPLEIVREADSHLNYNLDIRALDCGGSRELSDIYLLFQ